MNSSWLYQLDTLWIVIALLVAMALAGEIGSSVGRRWHPRTDDARRGHIGSVLGSLLGLLALLLGFTFAMSATRYDLRRQNCSRFFRRPGKSPGSAGANRGNSSALRNNLRDAGLGQAPSGTHQDQSESGAAPSIDFARRPGNEVIKPTNNHLT